MSRSVLDASAVLAVLFREKGAEAAMERLPASLLSSVNLSEVITRSVDSGMPLEEARIVVYSLPCQVVPFDGDHAMLAASLRAATRSFGLSLGDRACLALGLSAGLPVVTAERAWEGFDVGVKVIRIR